MKSKARIIMSAIITAVYWFLSAQFVKVIDVIYPMIANEVAISQLHNDYTAYVILNLIKDSSWVLIVPLILILIPIWFVPIKNIIIKNGGFTNED